VKKLFLVVLLFVSFFAVAQSWPLKGWSWESSPQGDRPNPKSPSIGGVASWHEGVDLAAKIGTPVASILPGVVESVYRPTNKKRGIRGDSIYGGEIVVKCWLNGIPFFVRYGHLSETWVKEGQAVRQAEYIGLSGNTGQSTGPHLHIAALIDIDWLLSREYRTWRTRR
jgi:murein DD-endopeptidase MepM/ murein hydrolase activator NlpD